MAKRFLLYGLIGLGLELIWTGLGSFVEMDYRLICQTSVWMLPIYGLVVFLEPLFEYIEDVPIILRGGIYALAIFGAEYLTGWVLTRLGICPWDYSGERFSINGLIRLDYAPVWAIAGLIFERAHYIIKYNLGVYRVPKW